MELTKHTHATVVLTEGGSSLLIDPGAYTPNTPDLLAAADAVLFTHDHPDHVDADALRAELARRPDLPVFGPGSVADAVEGVRHVGAGDEFDAAGFTVTVFGGQHAPIHPDLPPVENVAFLVDGTVFHPGDAYEVPGVEVRTLLVPTSGPWAKLSEGVDFLRAVKPQRAIAIHDLMLSEPGQQSTSQFTEQLTGTPLEIVPVGSTVTL
ncbi:MBL fold metallo-hydrolase [Kineococcus aurantiacus]|uniref:L-ascorbate metabolism protein UlaG (Beta-lactamase superfamily) n=1 Tax=Kineococcus aurantiacus TaxID=37633 RepID=A0A7Y9AU85_9ACTN|nr:MBL fold metallo-hydrolase [Kineococcus aurantiacus]NYD21874.1 L-ascorbate metabolism protein UlaG (beta-lactamase superfamily) [Kineococcus aurantiacus]